MLFTISLYMYMLLPEAEAIPANIYLSLSIDWGEFNEARKFIPNVKYLFRCKTLSTKSTEKTSAKK